MLCQGLGQRNISSPQGCQREEIGKMYENLKLPQERTSHSALLRRKTLYSRLGVQQSNVTPLKINEVPENVKYKFQTKHPGSVMVSGLITSDGKVMSPVFIKAEVKVDTNVYLGVLQKYVKPWIESNYTPEGNMIFQQDGAPPHTSGRQRNGWKTTSEF